MKTKAVRIHGKMDLRLEEIELPQVGPDDVQVKVISDSICMSTYKAAVEGEEHKRVPNDVAEHPTIVGHEFCGVIEKVGAKWAGKFALPNGAFAIDTMGMRGLGIWASEDGLKRMFSEIDVLSRECTHQSEPGCAVRRAIEMGELSIDR